MPPGNYETKEIDLIRAFIYGPAKTRKTMWAMLAAEAGYNVVLIDADDGSIIIKQIPEKLWPQINIIRVVDDFDRSVAALFMTLLLKGEPFYWDEQRKMRCQATSSIRPENSYYYLDINNFNRSTVFVVDSWTALKTSLINRYGMEKKIDVSDPDALEDRWGFYQYLDYICNWMLAQLHALPCHLIVVGHEQYYEKFKGKGKARILVSSRTQPQSVSGPHGQKVAKDFGEIMRFTISAGTTKIDTRSHVDRDGGCRVIPPKEYDFKDLQWRHVCQFAGLPIYKEPQSITGLEFYGPGELKQLTNKANEKLGFGLSQKPKEPVSHEGSAKLQIEFNKGA